MFEGWANGEALLRVEFPGFAVVGIGMDENHAAKGAIWSGVVIESSIEVLPGGELRSESGLAKEVED